LVALVEMVGGKDFEKYQTLMSDVRRWILQWQGKRMLTQIKTEPTIIDDDDDDNDVEDKLVSSTLIDNNDENQNQNRIDETMELRAGAAFTLLQSLLNATFVRHHPEE
jgi:hypothetical protein